jgi:hypothetical protein
LHVFAAAAAVLLLEVLRQWLPAGLQLTVAGCVAGLLLILLLPFLMQLQVLWQGVLAGCHVNVAGCMAGSVAGFC